MRDVRPAAVAGMFYPDAPAELAADVRTHLARAASSAAAHATPPKALIVPHAGFVYSGPIAGSAYARLGPGRDTIDRVLLFGPTHRVPVRGLALPTARAFATPLGPVAVDREACAGALALPQVRESDAAHAFEHSLEVQLPFLQEVLGTFRIVPFAVGDATPEEVAEVMELLWGGPETVIVVSSDLSHYHRYAEARTMDRATGGCHRCAVRHARPRAGVRGDPDQRAAARRAPARTRAAAPRSAQLRRYRGRQVARGRLCVVRVQRSGRYPMAELISDGRCSRSRARRSARSSVSLPRASRVTRRCSAPAATFVTLKQSGELRGCIGSLQPLRPLAEDVRENAIAAAFRDPRFPPLSVREYATTSVEVSLLSADERLDVATEAELLTQLRPGIDGLILRYGGQRATFLPQVWESLPEPRAFVSALKRKAGLPAGFWSPQMSVSRYAVTRWTEIEFAASEEER